MMKIEKLSNKKSDKYKVVSFDLFDTLIKRAFFCPKELFKFIEKEYGYDFYNVRIRSEQKAREISKYEEITIEEIYEQCDYSKTVSARFIGIELQTEIKYCRRNEKMVRCLDNFKKNGYRIMIITDTYLPRNTIEDILRINNISYDELYVSSEIKYTKLSGRLFKEIAKDKNIKPKEWIHIGDNFKSDYLAPMRIGIKSIHISTIDYKEMKYIPQNDSPVEYKRLCSLLRAGLGSRENLSEDLSYYLHVGYESLGPILSGFVGWLEREFVHDKIEKVFFLARDGQVIQNAYKVYAKEPIENHYMFASRRSLIVPTLSKDTSLDNIKKSMFWPRFGTVKAFFKKIGLEYQEYISLINEYGFDLEQLHEYSLLFSDPSFIELYKSIEEDVKTNSNQELKALSMYLSQIGFCGNIAIVDIGWHGNMQCALEKVVIESGLNVNLCGYYIGVSSDNSKVKETIFPKKGYLFDVDYNVDIYNCMKSSITLFEMLFSADHGSVKSFELHQNNAVATFEEYEYVNSKDYCLIKQIQNAALMYIEDEKNMPRLISSDPNIRCINFLQTALFPEYMDVKELGNIYVMGDEKRAIAAPKSILYYLFHYKEFINDITTCAWRVGFLRRLFVINLPYYKLYNLLRIKLKGRGKNVK